MNRTSFIQNLKVLQATSLPGIVPISHSSDSISIASLLNENTVFIQILQRYTHDQGTRAFLSSLYDLQMQYMYCLLTNNSFSMTALNRMHSDLLLKLTVYLSTDKDFGEVSRTTFRYLKEALHKLNFKESDYERIANLEGYFSKFSDIIHDKNGHQIQSIEFLSDQLNAESQFGHVDASTMKNFNEYYLAVIFPLLNINYSRLGTVDRAMIDDCAKDAQVKKIKCFLKF